MELLEVEVLPQHLPMCRLEQPPQLQRALTLVPA